MTSRRILELGLAALIAGAGLFAAFVPGASSDAPRHDLDPALNGQHLPTPRLNPAYLRDPELYRDLRMSEASRSVANAILSRATIPASPAPRERIAIPEISTEGFSISPRALADSGDGWSATAMGVQVRVAPDAGSSEPEDRKSVV